MPSLQPEYEKLPVVKPVSETIENTTMIASTTSTPSTTSHGQTNANTKGPFQPTSTMAETAATTITTETSDKLTTDYKTGDRLHFSAVHSAVMARKSYAFMK